MSTFQHVCNCCIAYATPIPAIQKTLPDGRVVQRLAPVSIEWHRARHALAPPTNYGATELKIDGLEVGAARSAVAKAILEYPSVPEFVFFLDYDVIPEQDALRKLVYRARCFPDHDIFAGVYCLKDAGVAEPLIYTDLGSGPYWDWTVGDLLYGDRIKGVHMGLTLIRSSLLKRMQDATPDKPLFVTEQEYGRDKNGRLSTNRGTEDLYFCFPSGTDVVTDVGIKDISSVSVGDSVLSHRGKWSTVSSIMSREYCGPLISVNIAGFGTVRATPAHRFWVRRDESVSWINAEQLQMGDMLHVPKCTDPTEYELRVAEWIPVKSSRVRAKSYKEREWLSDQYETKSTRQIASESGVDQQVIVRWLRRHNISARNNSDGKKIARRYIATVSPQSGHVQLAKRGITKTIPARIKLTPEFGRLCGLYLAEGHIRSSTVVWSLNLKTEEHLADWIVRNIAEYDSTPSIVKIPEASALRVAAKNATLAALFKALFATGSSNKRIPACVTRWPIECILGLIRGYLEGDGCLTNDEEITFTTVSKHLAFGIKTLFATAGMSCGIRCCKNNPTSIIQGRVIRLSPCRYEGRVGSSSRDFLRGVLGLPPLTGFRQRRCFYYGDNSGAWYEVKSITSENFSGNVFNLSVDGDESYTLTACTVHNCSIATREFGAKILVDTGVLAGHQDYTTGKIFGLPADCPPVKRAKWMRFHDSKTNGDGKEPKLKRAIDLGAGDLRREWPGYETFTTDLRPETEPDYVQDSRHLTLQDDSFSMVNSSHHLEHLPRFEQEKVWSEIYRICEPGGKIEHVVPSLEWAAAKVMADDVDEHVLNVLYGAQESHGYEREMNCHYFGYTKQIGQSLAESAGFVNVRCYDWRDEGKEELTYNLVITGEKPMSPEKSKAEQPESANAAAKDEAIET